MDSGFDGKRREEEADRFFGQQNRRRNEEYNKAREDRIKFLEKEVGNLWSIIVYLKKNGYRYDQLTTKMRLCDRCGDTLMTDKKDAT